MKNFDHIGRTIKIPAPVNCVSGQLIFLGAIAGVAATNQNAGEDVAVDVEGCFWLPKTAALALVAGQPAKATSAGVIDAAGANVVGYVAEKAAAGSTTVSVKLIPNAAATFAAVEVEGAPVKDGPHAKESSTKESTAKHSHEPVHSSR